MTWQTVGAAVLLVLSGGAALYLIRQLKARKERIASLLPFIGAVFSVLLPAFKPSELPPDYVFLNQPWLETVLTVSQLKDGKFVLTYDMMNHGKLPMYDPRLFFVSPTVRHVDKSIMVPKVISPGGKFVFRPLPFPFEM